MDPHTLTDGYELDVLPSRREAEVLRRLRSGDRIVVVGGSGYAFERGLDRLRAYLVRSLLNQQWISPPCPDGPLFGVPTDGRMNLRGSHALRRLETRN
jgi:hypothetical protein